MQKLIRPKIPNFLEVRNSGIHSRGLFTKSEIKKGTEIIQYGGELVSKKQSEKRIYSKYDEAEKDPFNTGENYIFELNKKYDIDGDFDWNIGKFANHSCEPNVEFIDVDGEIWLVAAKDINPEEELTVNYGYSFESFEDFPCKCGCPNCIGYMVAEEYFDKVKKELEKRKSD
ncbi:MAG: SET domain-containing protein-lysine N-methyltransferase [Candidatus Pacearchaeota archaeon]|jgi:SET domain-containing protein